MLFFAHWPVELAGVGFRVATATQDAHRGVFLGMHRALEDLIHNASRHPLEVVHPASVNGADRQVGGRDTGVRHENFDFGTRSLQLVVKCIGEDDIGEFCLLVALEIGTLEHLVAGPAKVPTVFAEVLGVQRIAHFGFVHLAGSTGMVHDPCLAASICRLLQELHAEACEQEVGEVVGLHLNVAAVLGGDVPKAHDAGVVAQNVEAAARQLTLQLQAGLPHALEAHQIAVHEQWLWGPARCGDSPHLVEGGICARRGPVDHDDPRLQLGTDLRADQARA
mmetsp:Transcript_144609/g.463354  ORF Transcript_144609/g.463354 Transcript_144609/m.463354 type:complete len:279 (+) Transcript_144609:309-1145(+)